jgi:hypothetical protein
LRRPIGVRAAATITAEPTDRILPVKRSRAGLPTSRTRFYMAAPDIEFLFTSQTPLCLNAG